MRNTLVRKDTAVSAAEYRLATMKVGERHYRACDSGRRFDHQEAMYLVTGRRQTWKAAHITPAG